ncbi:hypothetical protein F2Q69_00054271 [Brassica cretica]|uniref:Uncharacterized protein n=1 Tax=Brassica cretica TaxID=69181 RepID=A0A8S9N613_BRACR|nr:hypothetical protein F2Q69_00054271 [Brassica cretica]
MQISPLFLPLSPCFLSRCSEFTPPRFRSGIEELGVLEKHRDGAGEGFLWVEQRDGGHGLVSDLAAGRDLFSSLSSVLLLLGVGEKSRMVRRLVASLGGFSYRIKLGLCSCGCAWSLVLLSVRVECRLRGLLRAVLGCAQSLRADHRASQLYGVLPLVFTADIPFVASALFQIGCVLRLAACW